MNQIVFRTLAEFNRNIVGTIEVGAEYREDRADSGSSVNCG